MSDLSTKKNCEYQHSGNIFETLSYTTYFIS